ncbi:MULTISPECIES: aspartate aminotransferase family protein [Paraburkholderia]|uniref:Aspartate aminotransferase family protein n=1 Tax=Paraburkholderia dipogonis TaxID=1211383 RepID=A0A4Y8MH18_9BURK|nr:MULTISPECIES: aspartate aminotransferase family protein [Paraburkholderia]RKR31297.1 putrescine aminotransferase [Paraburkholderia sp. BL17N1]TFE36731.1 aspartate aminotransferase family protein [Paraburkholderia dipogonis]
MNYAQDLLATDHRHLIHPFLPKNKLERTIFTRGKGCKLWDVHGREYLDGTGGLWLAQIGHGREEIAEAAARQIKQLEYFTCFWDYSHERAIELAEVLAVLAPDELQMSFFTSGGSEGDDAAIKTARFYHAQKAEPSRTWILSRNSAYHGAAYGGGTATGFEAMREGTGPGLPHVAYLTAPNAYRSYYFDGQDPTDFCVAELEKTIASIGAENIAAMIAEPIMGVGGMVIPPADYWTRMSAVLKKHGILLIFDEVVTAFGRTGTWFASERFGVTPDIVVTAKGISSGYIPLGAVLMTREVADIIREGYGIPFGYTYSGHPVACAVALENLRIIKDEDLIARSNEMGAYFAEQFTALRDNPCVGEVRQIGMAIGIELVTDKKSRQPIPEAALTIPDVIREETGVIVRISNYNNICMSPPLTITKEEADRAVEAVCGVLKRLKPDGTV